MSDKLVGKKSESGNVSGISIVSNKDPGKIVDISGGLTDLYYYESILQETIRVELRYADTGNSVPSQNGGTTTVLEGLPLVGTEKVNFSISDNSDNKIKLDLYVNTVTPISEQANSSLVELQLVSKEYLLNEERRLNTRFDGKISDHVRKILTGQKFLNSQKNLDIEQTENIYNFIGNNKKPFYVCTWLAKKGIPGMPKAKGNTAGYFFYETHKGFNFKSIEKLLDQKPKKKLIYNETPDTKGENLPNGYDGKVIERQTDNNINAKSKLEIGAYSTRVVLFDPFNCKYEIITPSSEETEGNVKLAGKNLPVFNSEFGSQRSGSFTRTTYTLIDTGSLPSGSTDQQIEKSKEPNFDPKNILNQSTMRYNQLFTVRTTITIPGDFSLNAGDIIFVDTLKISDDTNKEFSKEFGGIYMIADLCHYITPSFCYTKLNLVRDSYGRKPN